MSKPDDYLWDGSGPPDPDVQRLEKLLAPLAHDRPLDELKLPRPKRRRAPWIIGGAVALAAAAALVLIVRGRASGPCGGTTGFAFTAQGGTVGCGDGQVAKGVLPIGGVLDTGSATAVMSIAEIGTAELSPNTRLRLDVSEKDHRQEIHLERGKMHARVSARPRIFAVTTPSTGVTDLGCEYTIEIDTKGKGWIEVQSGQVELETRAKTVMVAPAGTTARLLEDRHPSVPMSIHASMAMRAAVADYEQDTAGALDRVIQLSTDADAITLLNLAYLVRQDGPSPLACDTPCTDKERVLNRLAELRPLHPGITVRDVVTNDAELRKWRDDIVDEYIVEALEEAGATKK